MRELVRRTDFSERSIRHWLSHRTSPRNPILRRAWDRALAAAKAKVGAE